MPGVHRNAIIIGAAAATCLAALAGCHTAARVDTGLPDYAQRFGFQNTGSDEVLNVQAIRRVNEITITNTSTIDFGPTLLWANARFSNELPRLQPGETVTLDLFDFRDQYGTPFRAGGFFAAERPDALVMMQIEGEPKPDGAPVRYGLIVVDGVLE